MKIKIRLRTWVAYFFATRYPDLYNWWNQREVRAMNRYHKRHRACCEYALREYCASKLFVNPKKACNWDYYPYRCPECGRVIPRRLMYKYEMLMGLLDELEEQKEKGK